MDDGTARFAYRLARELGLWDVEGMLSAMTWRQFVGWMRYYSVEPFGEERADLRSAIVASVIANTHRDPKKRPEPFSPRDFMLFQSGRSEHTRAYRPITDREQWSGMTRTAREAFGAKGRGKSREVA